RGALVAKCGENVNMRGLARIESDVVVAYLHAHRIGRVAALTGRDAVLTRDIAMHVAASNPQSVEPSQVSPEVVEKEKVIFLVLNADKIAGKPGNIVENMV